MCIPHILCIVVLLSASSYGQVQTNRKTQFPKDAKLIVWGTVTKVIVTDEGEFERFKVKIAVENTERGYIREKGYLTQDFKEIWASCFIRKDARREGRSGRGHSQVPAEGQFIRAFLMNKQDDAYEGLYPDWFHELDLNEEQTEAMQWVQTIGPGCYLACDDDLPGSPITKMYTFRMWDSGVTDEDMKYPATFPNCGR